MALYWNTRTDIRSERGIILRKLGYTPSKNKTNLFYKKIGTGYVYADLRGTSMMSFSSDSRTYVYFHGKDLFSLFMREVALLQRNECEPRGSFYDTDESDGYFCKLVGEMPDGFCSNCGKDIIDDIDWNVLLPDWDNNFADEEGALYLVSTCKDCRTFIKKDYFYQLLDNWANLDFISRFQCQACGIMIEDFLDDNDLPPVCNQCQSLQKMNKVEISEKSFRKYFKSHVEKKINSIC